MAIAEEFDTYPIIEMIWRAGKKCYLPVVSAAIPKSLDFYLYEKEDVLVPNQYGILEPEQTNKSPFPLEQLEIVLVPLIGFDLQGHRLGTGGGYYDRSFAFLLSLPKPHQPYLMGLGYQCQAVDALPVDAWDVSLEGLLTEKKLIT